VTGAVAALAMLGAQQGGPASGGFHVVAAPASDVSPGNVSDSITAGATGGASPYTYFWSIKSGELFITSPDSQSTTFYCVTNTRTPGVAVCTVKDNAGAIATSNDVTIVLLARAGGGEGDN
jgi:hypothetical protein